MGDVNLGHGHGFASSIPANAHSGLVVSFFQNETCCATMEERQLQVNAKASPIQIGL